MTSLKEPFSLKEIISSTNKEQMDYHYDPIESFTIMSEENDKCSIEHTIAFGLMVVYGYDKWKRDKRCRS